MSDCQQASGAKHLTMITRIGIVGRSFAGQQDFLSGLASAWRGGLPPRPLCCLPEDIPAVAPLVQAWILLHYDCSEQLPVLRQHGGALVARAMEWQEHQIPVIALDDEAAGRLAGEHLLGACSGDLLAAGFPATFSRRRMIGFVTACTEAGRTVREFGHDVDPSVILHELPAGSGLFCVTDGLAHAWIAAAQACQRQVPEDLAIVGVNNDPLPAGRSLPLSSVAISLKAQGRQAGRLLQAQVDGQEVAAVTQIPPQGLIARASSGVFAPRQLLDISIPITPQLPVWPGDQPVGIEFGPEIDDDHHSTVSRLHLGTHVGTHIDAPAHFMKDGERIGSIALERLDGSCRVLDLRGRAVVDASSLAAAGLPEGIERVLLRTDNSELWASRTEFATDFVAITPEGAQWLVERGVRLVGIDYLSVAPYGDGEPTHRVLLGTGVVCLEGLNLSAITPGAYRLHCLPLSLPTCEGAPVRAVLESLI